MSEVIDRIKDPAVVEARRSLGQAGTGRAEAFLADGSSLTAQALDAGAPVEALFFLDPVEDTETAMLESASRRGIACHRLSRGVFFRLLGLGYETSVRVLAVVARPRRSDPLELLADGGCLMVGERTQDPRNVGVMVRTADAWRLAGCLFGGDSADPWCRASVRSTTGSVFRVPVTLTENLGNDLERLRERSVRVIGTSAHADVPCWQADLTGPCALVFGNETTGLSEEAAAACDTLVNIPMEGGAHSFNVTVAAGIILYERARQRSIGR